MCIMLKSWVIIRPVLTDVIFIFKTVDNDDNIIRKFWNKLRFTIPNVLYANGNKTFEAVVTAEALPVGVIYKRPNASRPRRSGYQSTYSMYMADSANMISNDCSIVVSRTHNGPLLMISINNNVLYSHDAYLITMLWIGHNIYIL